jgi:hypothetical protein
VIDGASATFGNLTADEGTDAAPAAPAPPAFLATTVHEYVLPAGNALTASGSANENTLAFVAPPSDDRYVARYPVIAELPESGGASYHTAIVPTDTAMLETDGAPGGIPTATAGLATTAFNPAEQTTPQPLPTAARRAASAAPPPAVPPRNNPTTATSEPATTRLAVAKRDTSARSATRVKEQPPTTPLSRPPPGRRPGTTWPHSRCRHQEGAVRRSGGTARTGDLITGGGGRCSRRSLVPSFSPAHHKECNETAGREIAPSAEAVGATS